MKLIGRHALRNRRESRWALWDSTGRFAADNMTIGAPLPRQLRALLHIGTGAVRDEKNEHRDRWHKNEIVGMTRS